MHGARLKKKKNHTSVCMTVPINVTDYPRNCNSFITPFVYFKALLHGIISLSPHVLSNDSFVAYVDFFHNNEGGKRFLKANVIIKTLFLKTIIKTLPGECGMGQCYYHLFDRLKIVFLHSPSRYPSSFLSLSLNFIFLCMKMSPTLWN